MMTNPSADVNNRSVSLDRDAERIDKRKEDAFQLETSFFADFFFLFEIQDPLEKACYF